jgi:hypothetical protein
MKRITCAAAGIALSGLAVVGCDRDDTSTASRTTTNPPASTSPAVDVDVDVNKDRMRETARDTGNAIERGVERTGEVLKEAGRDTRDAAANVGRRIDNAVDINVDRTGENAQPAGDRGTVAPNGTAAAPDAEGVRDVAAQVAQASLTKGGLDDLVERFVDQDRNRIGQSLPKDNAELDGRIEQFTKDWQAKYGQDFNIKDDEASLANFKIAQGEIGRGAAGAEVEIDRRADGTTRVDVDKRSGVDSPDSAAADANRNDPGRNVATIQIPASHGAPALTVPMIHEAPDSWRIDVPNTLTGEKLRANVLAHLTAVNNMKDQWPADVNAAHAMVAHHMLMAVMDKPVQQQ